MFENPQHRWDSYLIEHWHHFVGMARLVDTFLTDAGIKVEDGRLDLALVEIKRTPRHWRQLKMPVQAWVHLHLEPLSYLLWDSGLSDARILRKLKNWNLDTDENRLAHNERKRRLYERHVTKVQATVPRIIHEAGQEHNRMTDHVKETASKKNRH